MSGVYLFIFVSLIISVMSLYTEIVSSRFARSSSQQAAVGETMMLWHGAEYEFVQNPVIPAASFTSGCSLSPTFDVGNACDNGVANFQLPAFSDDPLALYGSRNYLPHGYNYDIKWYTMFFASAGANYILTFMDPTDDANDRRLGYGVDEVYAQLQNSTLPKISYGRVATNTCVGGAASEHHLMTGEFLNGVQVCYPVPDEVSNGSIGIISAVSR